MTVTPLELSDLMPSAHSFTLATCGEPGCGVHIISLDKAGVPILQTVMSPAQMREVISLFHKILRTQ